jgi:membrane protein DedA with SNARE-associated domain
MNWLDPFKYLGVAIGAFLEGEIAYITAIQASIAGQLWWPVMLAFFFIGTHSADWFFYWMGRTYGISYLNRSAHWQKQAQHFQKWLSRHQMLLLLSYRFIYGFRVVLPAMFGIARIPPRRFALMSLLSTAIWMSTYGLLGYLFSTWMLGQIRSGHAALAVFAGCGLLGIFLLYQTFTQSRIDKQDPGEE